jgi:hypothetical protein
MLLGGVAVVVVLLAIAGFFMLNTSRQNAEATATAQTATQVMVAQIAQETDTAIQEQTAQVATADANNTAIAIVGETSTADAIIVMQTQNAEASATAAVQQTNIAIANITQTASRAEVETAQAIIAQQTETTQAIVAQQTENAAATATEQARPTLTPSITPTDVPTTTPAISATATNTPRPSRTPTPELAISGVTDTRQVMLRYDGRSLIIANRDSLNGINVSDLVFVRFEPNDDGEMRRSGTYTVANTNAFNSEMNNLRPGRCLQILDSRQYSSLPPEDENQLAQELCPTTPFWTTTTTTFWVSQDSTSYFEVRLGSVDVLGRCQFNVPETRREMRCAVDLNLP